MFPSIFIKLMVKDTATLSGILDMAGGCEFLYLLAYDVRNGFSFDLIKKQTLVEIQDGLEMKIVRASDGERG